MTLSLITSMKIYLDIDGTLLDKHQQPAGCLHEFIEYVIQNYDCYWLTTHERDGDTTHLFDWLKRNEIPSETIELMRNIKPTVWDMLKTEAIDMSQDFIWFEDQPTTVELETLGKAGKTHCLYKVDRATGNGLCEWLEKQSEQ